MTMHFESKIQSSPDFAMLTVNIPANQTLAVEASSMASVDSHVKMKTKMKGGLSRLLTKESLFVNQFTAVGAPGEIKIAPGPPGDIAEYTLDGSSKLLLTGTSFLAATPGVDTSSKWQGLAKGFFSGESFFLMACSGVGQVWFNSYGAIFEVDVVGGYTVDTGHIVAFTDTLKYDIGKFGGYKSLFFSGEGLVCRFQGHGKVWIQTKKPLSLIGWADAYRRVEKSNS